MVTVDLDDGRKLFKPYVSGEGLSSDSSHVIIAGLGGQRAEKVTVRYVNGHTVERSGSFRNQTLSFESP
jgi:hypothetical protein